MRRPAQSHRGDCGRGQLQNLGLPHSQPILDHTGSRQRSGKPTATNKGPQLLSSSAWHHAQSQAPAAAIPSPRSSGSHEQGQTPAPNPIVQSMTMRGRRPLLTHRFPPHPMGCCQFSTIVHSVSKSLCWRPPGFCSPSRQWQGPKGLIASDKCM